MFEALTNVARHADARNIYAKLDLIDEWVTLRVTDDGRGIPAGKIKDSESLGLLGMHERASAWGGRLTIEGSPGRGTTVAIQLKTESHDSTHRS